MMADRHYVLDANVYIAAHRTYYSFDFGTTFWDVLRRGAKSGLIVSIDRVRNELLQCDDKLAEWVKNCPNEAFEDTNRIDVIEKYRMLMKWAVRQSQFENAARSEFGQSADAWIVAYAMAGGKHAVVTHETLQRDIKRRIKIPNL